MIEEEKEQVYNNKMKWVFGDFDSNLEIVYLRTTRDR